MSNFLEQLDSMPELQSSTSSRKGLADAIDHFLVDNKGVGFPPFELAERFGIEASQLRSIIRTVLRLGTKKNGKRYAKSSVKGYILYCLPYSGDGANNQYVAFKEGINPLTGEKMDITKPKK